MITILIIDDDPDILAGLERSLRAAGLSPWTAGNGVEGLAQAHHHHPDLVLCDIDMPELDGHGVLEALRSEPQTADIPLIFLTGKNQPADFRQGMALGAENYLPKPVAKVDLLTAITTCLHKRAQQREREEDRVNQLAVEVAGTLNHELRTPLSGILPIPHLLAACEQADDAETVHALRDILRESSERLYRAVERFLFYTELSALVRRHKGQPLSHLSSDLGPSLAATGGRVAAAWSRAHDLSVTGSASIHLEPSHWDHLAGELIDNAFKFSPAGTPVMVSLALENGALVLRVADQGRGMSDLEIKNVQVFHQFNRAVFEQQGFGLGLGIVQLLVRLYQGELIIQSQSGQSTVVTARLPVPAPENSSLRA